ncbi:MAG: Gfo/Idh/MocA family oxidoreductase [Anaerolineae bacterium]|nr:Gfo/Idh/MocA family oxidoreductase [Anaerolineae bacterium]
MSVDSGIRIGVIGYGYWGPNLVRNFVHEARSKVEVISDVQPERLALAKSQYPGIATTQNYREVIDNPNITAVAIATPVAAHYPIAKEALLAGKHVLVEKPMAATIAEAEELVALAEKNNCTLLVDHTFVYTNQVRTIKSMIEAGEIGELYYFDSVRIALGLFQSDVNVVWDLAPHDLSILNYLTPNKPISISAVGMAHVQPGQEDIAYLTVHYDNNFIAHIHVNWLAPVKIRRTIIGGSKQMIVYDHLNNTEPVKVYDKGVLANGNNLHQVLISYRTGDVTAPYIRDKEALSTLTTHFADCILHGDKPITSGEAGLEIVRMIEAAQRSVANNGHMEQL